MEDVFAVVERVRRDVRACGSQQESYINHVKPALSKLSPDARRAVMARLGLQYIVNADALGITFVEYLEGHGATLLAGDHVQATVADLKHVQTTDYVMLVLTEHQRARIDAQPAS